ncbi:hypothetical protein Fcan01_20575 [Folsomia candida]|uniref:Uncharacterized protein n=1 Tax=Folsomia candida TaxID=158441 RepID=A0A226DGI1_FOLCA|nr:hypothetical protein Fcan01_20575 [Folsomia candida]
MFALANFLSFFTHCILEITNFQDITNLTIVTSPVLRKQISYKTHPPPKPDMRKMFCFIQVLNFQNTTLFHKFLENSHPNERTSDFIIFTNPLTPNLDKLTKYLLTKSIITKAIFLHLDPDHHLKKIHILTPNLQKFSELKCPTPTCLATEIQTYWSNLLKDMNGFQVYLHSSDSHVNFDSSLRNFGVAKYYFHYCTSDEVSRYSSYYKTRVNIVFPPKWCILLDFILRKNLSSPQQRNDKQSLKFVNFAPTKDVPTTRHIRLFPFVHYVGGLSYTIFVNKSELALNLFLTEPFDQYTWTFLIVSGILMALTMSIIASPENRKLSLFPSALFWCVSTILENSVPSIEKQLRRTRQGGWLIATWSLMMIIITNTYSDLVYVFFMSTPTPVGIPDTFPAILHQSDLAIYTFTHSADFAVGDNLLHDANIPKSRVKTVGGYKHDLGMFNKPIVALSYTGSVGEIKIERKFVALLRNEELIYFAILMRGTNRFFEVRNADFRLVKLAWGWYASNNVVGESFAKHLQTFQDNGIYSWWGMRYDRFFTRGTKRIIRDEVKNITGVDHIVEETTKRRLSLDQLKPCFLMLFFNYFFSGVSQVFEYVWLFSISRHSQFPTA